MERRRHGPGFQPLFKLLPSVWIITGAATALWLLFLPWTRSRPRYPTLPFGGVRPMSILPDADRYRLKLNDLVVIHASKSRSGDRGLNHTDLIHGALGTASPTPIS